MGIMKFMENIGKDVFNIGQKAASESPQQMVEERQQKLKQYVQGMGLNIQNLDMRLDATGHLVLTGIAATRADAEKAALAAGNVTGISAVDNQITVTNDEGESGTYTVQSGDTLSKIAKAEYGDANKYNAIFEANRPMLSDPDKIYPGQVLRIPKMS